MVLFIVDDVTDAWFIETNRTLTMKSEIISKTLVPFNTDYADRYVSEQWRRGQFLVDFRVYMEEGDYSQAHVTMQV